MRIVALGLRGFPGVPGGIEKHCEELYPRLTARGCRVTVLTRRPYMGCRPTRTWRGVSFIHLPAVRQQAVEAFLHTFLGVLVARMLSPDIVHIHGIGPAVFTPLARLLGLRVVVTNHGPDYRRKKWGGLARFVLKTGEAVSTRRADRVIAISRTITKDLEHRYDRPDITFLPNGVTIQPRIPPGDQLRKHGLKSGGYVFTACRFVPEKGLLELIAAYRALGNPPWKLVIAGGADHETDYSRRVKEQGRAAGAILTGFVTGQPLAELFSNAGLFVLPSYYEGLPIALLEALSYELPVLVSDLPAHRETPLARFRYFPAGDSAALARALKIVFEAGISPEEQRSNTSLLRDHYDWDVIAERTLQAVRPIKGA